MNTKINIQKTEIVAIAYDIAEHSTMGKNRMAKNKSRSTRKNRKVGRLETQSKILFLEERTKDSL